MLRASCNLPSIASPAISICAVRLSLFPILNLTPSSSAKRISTAFAPSLALLSQTLNYSTSSLSPKRVLRIMDHPAPRASASYSTGSNDIGRELLVQHLLVKEEDQNILYELQKRIIRGEDLSDLAVEYSICPSKEEGGMLGWVRKGQMVPEFEEAAFNAPLNKVVKCKTQFGWHLLQVLSEREESVLEDIQPEDFHAKLQDPDFFEDAQCIDVREPHEVGFTKTEIDVNGTKSAVFCPIQKRERASLSGFQVLPLQQFGSWGPEVATKLDPQKDTYVLCHHGMRSLQVAKWLQTQGFRKIYNIAGGIHAYALKADQSIPTY